MVAGRGEGERVDAMFHALSDATRRDILERVGAGDSSVSRLADRYAMSFAAVQKHVAVLERAGLITKQKRGREQLVRTDPSGLLAVRTVLDQLEATWIARVSSMTVLLDHPGPTTDPVHDKEGTLP